MVKRENLSNGLENVIASELREQIYRNISASCLYQIVVSWILPVFTSDGFGPFKVTDAHLSLMKAECKKKSGQIKSEAEKGS